VQSPSQIQIKSLWDRSFVRPRHQRSKPTQCPSSAVKPLLYLYTRPRRSVPRSASSFLSIPLFRSEFVMGDFDRNLSWAAVLRSIVHRDSFLAPLPKTSQRLHGGDGRRQSVPRKPPHFLCRAPLGSVRPCWWSPPWPHPNNRDFPLTRSP
jgi:hypothetical protein